MSVKGKKVLVGITGGIACYKVPYLVRFIHKAGGEVRVIMTESATKFITPLTLESVSQNPVAVTMFPETEFVSTRHIDLGHWPELVVVAPATANFMGKVSAGICDDLLTTVICATDKPVMIAPAMNPQMWANKVTQRNFRMLQELGYLFVPPEEGDMACEDVGIGRMAEPEKIFEAVTAFFDAGSKKKALSGKRILVTAGPTREALDPVRYLTNHSSGKMGYALAERARAMGAEVTLISGPTGLAVPSGVRVLNITSTQELYEQVTGEFEKCDCLIMAAAPADFAPDAPGSEKIKRGASGLHLQLKPTVDILKEVSKKKGKGQLLVGFALETHDGIANAKRKLKEKHLDVIVLNSPGPGTGFECDTNDVTLITSDGEQVSTGLASKGVIAGKILDLIARML